jgi:hypothetical protein
MLVEVEPWRLRQPSWKCMGFRFFIYYFYIYNVCEYRDSFGSLNGRPISVGYLAFWLRNRRLVVLGLLFGFSPMHF